MVYKDLWAVSFPRCTVGHNIAGTVASVCRPLPTRTQQLLGVVAGPFARSLSASLYNLNNPHSASPMKLVNYTLLVYNRQFFLITLKTSWILLLTKTGWTTVWIFWLNIRNILSLVPSGILLQRRKTCHRNLLPQIATKSRRSLNFKRKNRLL